MKSSRFALGLVGLCLVGLWYAGGGSALPTTRAAETPQVSAPLTHANLSVYLVFGPDAVAGTAKLMSLQEALDRDLATVHETGNVNTLAVENRSPDCELFVQSGDIVKGGRQDRVVQHDVLLPPNSGRVPLPAHCVEQSRWTNRGKEDAGKFSKCDNFAAGRALRYANYAGQQGAVWANVKDNQNKLNQNLNTTVNAAASPTSFQLSLEADAVRARVGEYEAALKAAAEDRGDVIGVVFAVNGQVVGAEVYGSNALFRKAWPKLLTAAAVEAVTEGDAPKGAAPSAREVEYFLAHGADAEPAGARPDATAHNPDEDVQRVRRELADHPGYDVARVERATQSLQRNVAVNASEPLARERWHLMRAAAGVNNDVQNLNDAANPVGQFVNDNVDTDEPGRARSRLSVRGAAPEMPVAGANPDGNRLNTAVNENGKALMVESRDAGRGGAVIHRSYLKK